MQSLHFGKSQPLPIKTVKIFFTATGTIIIFLAQNCYIHVICRSNYGLSLDTSLITETVLMNCSTIEAMLPCKYIRLHRHLL